VSKFNKHTPSAARILAICLLLFLPLHALLGQKASKDTTIPAKPVVRDSTYIADSVRHRQIKKATVRSAIIPGWGQITNNQAWKVPFVYAAVGIPVYLFFVNLEQYQVLRDTYIIMTDDDPTNDDQIPENLKPLSPNSIKFYRDEYRKNVDYSVLAFLIAWGLNVADAAVFANLRDFDVSDKLSMRVNPGYNPATGTAQIGLVLKTNNTRKVPKYNFSK
jgi:Family of unknown function (DUF5683)